VGFLRADDVCYSSPRDDGELTGYQRAKCTSSGVDILSHCSLSNCSSCNLTASLPTGVCTLYDGAYIKIESCQEQEPSHGRVVFTFFSSDCQTPLQVLFADTSCVGGDESDGGDSSSSSKYSCDGETALLNIYGTSSCSGASIQVPISADCDTSEDDSMTITCAGVNLLPFSNPLLAVLLLLALLVAGLW
jgi:hypothetical protein